MKNGGGGWGRFAREDNRFAGCYWCHHFGTERQRNYSSTRRYLLTSVTLFSIVLPRKT